MRVSRKLCGASGAAPKKTVLNKWHIGKGGRMVEFGGWEMPLSYGSDTTLQSHLHVRSKAGLFDVSHMLQIELSGRHRHDFVESLTVADVRGLAPGNMCLSVMLTEQGTIIDDTMITNEKDVVNMVLNAGCAEKDLVHLNEQLQRWQKKGSDVRMRILSDEWSLIALQGPAAASVLTKALTEGADRVARTPFLGAFRASIYGRPVGVNRCGYTGEDGFELQVRHKDVEHVADQLVGDGSIVRPAGLGPRDTLRLEAGLCLYGNDIDDTTTPVEASLAWTIAKRRRSPDDAIKFPGWSIITKQLEDKNATSRRRVGVATEERRLLPSHADVLHGNGVKVGHMTSGTMSPSLNKGIGMAYLNKPYNMSKTTGLYVEVRGKRLDLAVAPMPFVPHTYYKN